MAGGARLKQRRGRAGAGWGRGRGGAGAGPRRGGGEEGGEREDGGEGTAVRLRRGARRTFAKLGRRRACCCQQSSMRSTSTLGECAGISGRIPLVATESATSTGVCCGKGIE